MRGIFVGITEGLIRRVFGEIIGRSLRPARRAFRQGRSECRVTTAYQYQPRSIAQCPMATLPAPQAHLQAAFV